MGLPPQVKPYPEWRQLLATVKPLLESKTKFSYDELEALCGADIRTGRGRQQFYKFRRVALKDWKVWFENTHGFGYIVIPASEQPKAAVQRVRSAKRKVNMAKAINANIRADQLTEAQRLLQAQTGALIEDLARTFSRTSRQLTAVAAKFKLDLSPEDLKALEAPPPPKKKAPASAPQFRINVKANSI